MRRDIIAEGQAMNIQACMAGAALSAGLLLAGLPGQADAAGNAQSRAQLDRLGCQYNDVSCSAGARVFRNHRHAGQARASTVARYVQACERGTAEACNELGFMYEAGRYVRQNPSQAAALYRQACEGGSATGCSNYGVMYANEDGVAQDDVRALAWFSLAAIAGDETGVQYGDLIAGRMTETQVASARALAQRCEASRYADCG